MKSILKYFGLILMAAMASLSWGADKPVKLEPGQSFALRFPDMPPTLWQQISHKPSQPTMSVFLPTNYTPDKPFPVLIFLGGGGGSWAADPVVARKLTGEKDYICVNLPYFRKDLTPPELGINNEDVKFMWPLYKQMLAKLEQTVPNINKARRIIGGFSNGAHVPAGLINENGEEAADYFHAFIFVEGGVKLTRFDLIKGKELLLLFGGQRHKDWSEVFAKPAKEAGVKVTYYEMPGVGHAFPEKYYDTVAQWLAERAKE